MRSILTDALYVINKTTGKRSGVWIDPTPSSKERLEQVLELQKLQSSVDDKTYKQHVALFVESLIKNGGYSFLEISCVSKNILKHHNNFDQLCNTIKNIDLSYIRPEDKSKFNNIEEFKRAITEFISTLIKFVEQLIGKKEAQSAGLQNFGQFSPCDSDGSSAQTTDLKDDSPFDQKP